MRARLRYFCYIGFITHLWEYIIQTKRNKYLDVLTFQFNVSLNCFVLGNIHHGNVFKAFGDLLSLSFVFQATTKSKVCYIKTLVDISYHGKS